MSNEVTNPINNYHALAQIEIDTQIATAKQYPRNPIVAREKVKELILSHPAIAEQCFYHLERENKQKNEKTIIEGFSVRFAEFVVHAWGNLRVQTRVVDNDGKKITIQGVCHDLESNSAVQVEVNRRITTSNGHTFSEDMQIVTANAGNAIAYRNAVFKTVPAALFSDILDEAKNLVRKSIEQNLTSRITKMYSSFGSMGVTPAMLYEYLNIGSEEDITASNVQDLLGVYNAIKEGSTTVEETFGYTLASRKEQMRQNEPTKLL
jgi:hypothetical protein